MHRASSNKIPGRMRWSFALAAILTVASVAASSGDDQREHAAQLARSRPNVLYIIADDLGYSDIAAFGGEIRTPNLDALVAKGRLLTNFQTSTYCAVTRAMLYSGTDHRRALGSRDHLSESALSIAELFKDAGYHTYIAGKWHLGSDIARRQTPDARGFERSFVLLGGATLNHFFHEPPNSKNYAEDGRYVQPGPSGAGVEVYDTDFYTQKLISYIDSNRSDGKPFAAFATYTSPHFPLQAPDAYLNRYKGDYDVGYDVIRERRLARQKELGIIPQDFTPNPGLPETLIASPATPNYGTAQAKYINAVNPAISGDTSYVDYGAGQVYKKWNSLTADERKLQARYMEIYAAMVENLDHNIGLLLEHLKEIGQYENTFIVFQTDNGPDGSMVPAQDAANLINFDNLGKSGTSITYGPRWAEVSATPFKLFKGYTAEGGISGPAIVHVPGQKQRYPDWRGFAHVKDIAPTLLELAGIEAPQEPAQPLLDENGQDLNAGKVLYNGKAVYPITGLSFLDELQGRHSFHTQRNKPWHTEPVGEETLGRTYLRHGRWKAVFIEPPTGPLDGYWALYDMEKDRGEVHDLSAQKSDLLYKLLQEWTEYAARVGVVLADKPGGAESGGTPGSGGDGGDPPPVGQ